jgi:hypothetical protein
VVDTNGLPVRLALTAGEAHDNPTLFDFVEEPLDQIPRTVEIRAEADRLAAIVGLPTDCCRA